MRMFAAMSIAGVMLGSGNVFAQADPSAQALTAIEQACLDAAGPAGAGAPASPQAASDIKSRAEAAQNVCAQAGASSLNAEVLFHAAAAALASGDRAKNVALLTKAAETGFGPAMTRLGDAYLFGQAPGGADPAKALEWFQKAAAVKDAPGTTTLALLYQVGHGVARDPARAIDLMQQAAALDYHFAQFRLAQIYMTGEGIAPGVAADLGIPDTARAVMYYEQAVAGGNLTATQELFTYYTDPAAPNRGAVAEVARLGEVLAQSDYPQALAILGVFHETGQGAAYDPQAAADYYVRAMETGEIAFESLRPGAPWNWDRETALAFQRILQERGLYRGPLDAIIGPGSAAGARRLAQGN